MSSSMQSVAGSAGASSFAYLVTPGNLNGTPGIFGYADVSTGDSNRGSVSPIATLKGSTFNRLRAANVTRDFSVQIIGVLAQTFWRYVIVQNTAGGYRQYLSASAAAFSTAGSISIWDFGTGSSPPWTSTTAMSVIFFT